MERKEKMDLLTLKDFGPDLLKEVVDASIRVKHNPFKYSEALKEKTLLMLFEKPSLRTRVSFEVAMTQMGGHAIFYSIKDSPLGKKESISDTAKVISRYCDIMMARLYEHSHMEELAENAAIPVINALTNFSHPCQIVADLQTILEKKEKLSGLKLCYVGDSNNNVTHSLLYGCSMVGMNITVSCPKDERFMPEQKVMEEAKDYAKDSGATISLVHDPKEAVDSADIVYTDSWMSYHIPPEEQDERVEKLKPYQVNSELMRLAKPDAVFMHCLPAMRGMEVTSEVIDGKQSIVFDQAENRLHSQKAIILKLLGKL